MCQECASLRTQIALLTLEAKAWQAMANRAVAQTDEALAAHARMAAMIEKYMDERESHFARLGAMPGHFETKEN